MKESWPSQNQFLYSSWFSWTSFASSMVMGSRCCKVLGYFFHLDLGSRKAAPSEPQRVPNKIHHWMVVSTDRQDWDKTTHRLTEQCKQCAGRPSIVHRSWMDRLLRYSPQLMVRFLWDQCNSSQWHIDCQAYTEILMKSLVIIRWLSTSWFWHGNQNVRSNRCFFYPPINWPK